MSFLKDLDEKYVPRLAEALDRLVRKFPKPPEPSAPLPVIIRLRRWDDRWTAAGPLATFRDVPQLGGVVIGALVLAGSISLNVRIEARERAPEQVQASPDPDEVTLPEDGTLGPQLGENVPTYIDDSKTALRALAPTNPQGVVVAVVSFTSYRTPEQVVSLLGPLQVRRVFFRASGLPLTQATWHVAPVEDLVPDSVKAFRRVARVRQAEASELLKLAATVENDPPAKRQFEADGAVAAREAAFLGGPCRCVYAVVVRAQLRLLADALNLRGIRAVDVSNVDARLEDFTFTALLPEEKITVTGGNQE